MPVIETLIGPMSYAVDSAGALKHLWFGEHEFPGPQSAEVEMQIAQFFRRERRAFDLPLAPKGTPFQQAVWRELVKIPLGETRSYQQIANAVGQPTATRAVGAANGANPIALIVPCHRVIGSNGKLTGYAGGLDMKSKLLDWEAGAMSLFA